MSEHPRAASKQVQDPVMQRLFLLAAAAALSLSAAGCGYTPEQRAVSGGALGAATGAAIGAATGGGVGAALAGGAIGAAAGAIGGAATTPPPPPPPPPQAYYRRRPPPPPACARFSYDAYGNRYCASYYCY
jgi:hypothetical protein